MMLPTRNGLSTSGLVLILGFPDKVEGQQLFRMRWPLFRDAGNCCSPVPPDDSLRRAGPGTDSARMYGQGWSLFFEES
jgi:hypothetical protein